jgi:uncharacterized protein YutE (UPF0331/DUF86 family)
MLIICNSIIENNDLVAQVIRIHLWAEGFMDMILHQVSKYSEKETFAIKRKHLFELGLIDETRSQELKILNEIRNLVAHNLYPNKQILESIKNFLSYSINFFFVLL